MPRHLFKASLVKLASCFPCMRASYSAAAARRCVWFALAGGLLVIYRQPCDAASIQWLQQVGTAGGDDAQGVATDLSGGVFIAGGASGSLGGGVNAGGVDAYLRKYDSNGVAQWTRMLGSSAADNAINVTTDSLGNAYIVGQSLGNLGGQISHGGNDGFVAKYNSAGALQWTKLIGSGSYDVATDVAVDGGGSVYVTGYTDGDYGGIPNAGSIDAFLAKFDASGSVQWVRRLNSSNNKLDWNAALTIDPQGDIVVAGGTEGNLAGASGGADAFVRKYDPAGNVRWTMQFGTSAGEEAFDVCSDSMGQLFVTGYTGGNLGGQTHAGLGDAFLTKVSAAGSLEWTRLVGSALGEVGRSVVAGDGDQIFLTGLTKGSLGDTPNAGEEDAFLVEFDDSGNHVTAQLLGGAGRDIGRALAVSEANTLILAGSTTGAIAGPNAGSFDAFVASYGLATTAVADFNEDLEVDDMDLGIWRTHFGTISEATHAQGDADGDQDVDGADFLIWQQQFGSPTPTVSSHAPVPEPATSLLVAVAATGSCRIVGRMRQASVRL
jgi:hypothetical protein